MNISKFILTCLLLLGTAVTASAVASEQAHSHEQESTHQKIQLNQGKKWPIDASLHIGMSKIKTSIEESISEIHHKQFSEAQYKALADKVDAQLAYLFKNCKLPAAADAQLHILLFDIMQASRQMQSSDNPRSGAITTIKALQKYPHYFDDKDWQALKH